MTRERTKEQKHKNNKYMEMYYATNTEAMKAKQKLINKRIRAWQKSWGGRLDHLATTRC